MKVFYVAILVFAIMAGVTLYNAVFINDFCKETMEALHNIEPEATDNILNEIKAIHNTSRPKLKAAELSVPREKIETVKKYFDLLIIEAKNGELKEFEKNKKLLINQLTEIMELEKPKLSNII